MRAAIILALVVLAFALDALASIRIVRADLISPSQKIAWPAFAWLVPLLGAALALIVSEERDRIFRDRKS